MQSFKEALQLFQKNSMNLPMIEHEEKLNLMLEYLQHENEKDKKELQILRQEIIHESYIQSAINEETSLGFIEEIADFTRYFRTLAENSNEEASELSHQVECLKMDKNKLVQQANLMNHRINEMEKILGVGINQTQSQESNN